MEVVNDYRADQNILIRKHLGKVTLGEIIRDLDQVREEYKDKNLRGIVGDYNGSDYIDVYVEDVEKIRNYFDSYPEFFKNLKMAIIVDSPKIVIPMLLSAFEYNNSNFKLQSFSTKIAGINWVLL